VCNCLIQLLLTMVLYKHLWTSLPTPFVSAQQLSECTVFCSHILHCYTLLSFSVNARGSSPYYPCRLATYYLHKLYLHKTQFFLAWLFFLDCSNMKVKGILFSSILCRCPNQCNLCSLIVSVMVGYWALNSSIHFQKYNLLKLTLCHHSMLNVMPFL
jgi:hypothetical protein